MFVFLSIFSYSSPLSLSLLLSLPPSISFPSLLSPSSSSSFSSCLCLSLFLCISFYLSFSRATPHTHFVILSHISSLGGHITGKAACDDMCLSDSSWAASTGPIGNPIDMSRDAGGSSSGCASLVGIFSYAHIYNLRI